MGKLVQYLTILIFIDLMFLATGQLCSEGTCSLTSILYNSILSIGDVTFTQFFKELIGGALNLFDSVTGIAALLTGGGVIIGAFVASKDITVLFIPISFTLALIATDFVIITTYLLSSNPLAAMFIMAPISILYIITVVEWLRNKD